MATTPTKQDLAVPAPLSGGGMPAWPRGQGGASTVTAPPEQDSFSEGHSQPSALQALLAFSALHQQVRQRKALAARHAGIDAGAPVAEFEKEEQFVLDEVLQLVAERAVAITGADGLAIALAENNEIVLRAAAGTVRPDVGARIDRESAFSGACFRDAQVVTCDDTETDARVNLQASRRLGARSMVAVPLCGRRRVIGLLEAFSSWPFGFNDSDVRNLTLLAELVLGALKPEDEDRFAESAQVAAKTLEKPEAAHTPLAASVVAPIVEPVIASAVVPLAPAAVTAPSPVPASAPLPVPATKPEIAVPVAAAPASAPVVEAPGFAPAISEPLIEKIPEARTPATAAETAAVEPELFVAEAEPPTRKPVFLLSLIGVVIIAAFAGGVWWKMKTAQLGSAMIQTQKAPLKPVTVAEPKTTSPDSSSATNSDTLSESTESSGAPATAQELAKFPRVSGIRHWSSADTSTVVLDMEDQVQYEAHRLANPDRIYFDLHDTQLAPELSGKSIDIGDALLNRVRVAQPIAGMTRIVLETKGNSNFSVSLESNPYRLVVEVRKIGATPKGAVNLFPNADLEKKLMAIVVPPPTKDDLQMRARVPKLRIVVDAGHGGWDLGTVGRRGLLEKDLVLEIAQRLGKLLQSRLGMEVIYTRQDDNYIPLDDRANLANESQADLFVSVHANYSDLPSARGVETYYTNTFSAPGAKEAGSKDPDSAKVVGIKNAAPTLSSADLHERIEQSRRLAASVQRSLYGTLSAENPGLRDRGIKEAGFVVLTESAMPGILAEVSFVSSPTDEQKLRSDGYREQIAEALYKGIARYAVSSKGVKVAEKQSLGIGR